ncbi:MAG: SNF2-related protein, partial [Candidatus Methylomirabilales bacterium]
MTVNSQEPRWLVRARRQVPARTQARGARLLLEGQVRDLSGDASSASATVGPEQCRVALRYDAETALLVVGCDCAEYLQGDDCRHIVAAMLAAAQRGLLSQASGARDLLLMPEHEGDLFGDEEFLEAPVPRPGPVPGAAAPPGRPPAPAWQAPFELVRHALHVEPAEIRTWAGREIVYLLDLPAWRSGGTLPVAVGHRERKRNGDWSKFKPQAPPARIIPELPDPADRQLLSALLGAHAAALYPYDGYRAYGSGPGLFHLPLTGQRELLRTMCETGRCLARLAPGPQAEPVRLRWDEGPAWELCLDIGPAPKGPGLRLTGSLRRGEQRIPLSEPALLTAGGVVILRDAAAPFEDYGAYPWVPLLRQQGAIAIPAGQEAAAAAALLTLPKSPRLDLPEAMRYEPVRLPPRPRLTIRSARRGYGTQARLEADLVFEYDGRPVPDGETARGVVDVPGRRFLLRDPAAEQDAERLLRSLGFRRIGQGYATRPGLQLAPRHLAAAVPALLAAGWRVEAEGKLYRPAGHLHVEVTTGIDWFELAGAARFDDQEVALPRLLAALRKGEKTVLLDDGTLGLLPEEWLERYGLLAGLGEVARGVLRFGKSQAMLLDALLASRPEVRFDEAFAGAREALLRFERVEAAEAPAGFTGTLRPYQREGLGWLDFLRAFGFGGCLADDMGLGKTVQVLAMLAGRREATGGRPSLIVVPRSLVFNWKHEAARFAPGLRILDHTGAGRLRESASHFRDYDVVLTTYGTLRRDVAGLADTRFDYLILDEAQAVKNAGTQSAKAVRLLQGDHRLALSGTPVENHLGELWSLFEFLNPGMLGGAAVFKLFAGQNGRALSAEGRQVLGRALRPFILRRTKEQVAADLPPKMEQTIVCDMPA